MDGEEDAHRMSEDDTRQGSVERTEYGDKIMRIIDEVRLDTGIPEILKSLAIHLQFGIEELQEIYDHHGNEMIVLYKIISLVSKGVTHQDPAQELVDKFSKVSVTHAMDDVKWTAHGCDMDLVASYLEVYQGIFGHDCLLSKLHKTRLAHLPDSVFNAKARKSINGWHQPPFIEHSNDGMFPNSYIPLMNLMIRHELRKYSPCCDWVVLFEIHSECSFHLTFSGVFLDHLKRSIEKTDASVEKIILVLGVHLGKEMKDEGHVICVLVSRPTGKVPCITFLDGLWLSENLGHYYRFYIARLIQLKTALSAVDGLENMDILLSDACNYWLVNEDPDFGVPRATDETDTTWIGRWSEYCAQHDEFTKAYTSTSFKTSRECDIEWLRDMLSTPIDYERCGSKALVCPYEAALYIIGCIGGYMPRRSDSEFIDASIIFRISDKINREFAASILSGCCVFSAAAMQRVLHALDDSESRFLLIDSVENPPSDIYSWVFKADVDSGALSVYTLRNNTDSVSDFLWEPCGYVKIGNDDTRSFVRHLKETGKPLNMKKRRGYDPMDMNERQEDDPMDMGDNCDKRPKGSFKTQFLLAIMQVLDKILLS
jgi:hypothetical protein